MNSQGKPSQKRYSMLFLWILHSDESFWVRMDRVRFFSWKLRWKSQLSPRWGLEMVGSLWTSKMGQTGLQLPPNCILAVQRTFDTVEPWLYRCTWLDEREVSDQKYSGRWCGTKIHWRIFKHHLGNPIPLLWYQGLWKPLVAKVVKGMIKVERAPTGSNNYELGCWG